MEPSLRLEDPVSAHALGDANEGRDQHHWNARSLDFLSERSSATRARSSSSSEDRSLYSLSLHVQGYFLSNPRHCLDISHVSGGNVIVIVKTADGAVFLEETRSIKRHGAVWIVICSSGVAAAVPRLRNPPAGERRDRRWDT